MDCDGEAQRRRVVRLDAEPWLRPAKAALRDAFGPAPSGDFEVQRAGLVGGGSAALVTSEGGGPSLALALADQRLVWSKPRPTGGLVTPVEHLAIAPRPDGGVALFVWIASLHTVAARMWADDGNAFGDFEVFAPKACDALSVAYAFGRGWWVLCVSPDGTRGQRLRDDGTIAWERAGLALGATGPAGPATVVVDSPLSAMVLQRVAAIGGDRLLVFRYDVGGRPLWARPVELGVMRDPRRRGDRVDAVRVSRPDGSAASRVRLTLSVPFEGRRERVLEVGPAGDVTAIR